MSAQVLWYAARASGIVAWALAAGSVIWGLALSSRALGQRPRPAWLFDLHRFLGGMALTFTGVHVVSILLDTYTHFGMVNVLVPLTGSWHPVAVAWGIVGLYALLAVELTSLARSRISKRLWRRVHVASFALFVVTTIHALSAGTDRGSPAFIAAVVATCLVVLTLIGVRVARARTARRRVLGLVAAHRETDRPLVGSGLAS
jgi:DMSO/TMAO reductase YedYZ heme-binding membrane subunit